MDRIERNIRIPCSFLEYILRFSFIFLKWKTFMIACLSKEGKKGMPKTDLCNKYLYVLI